MPKSSNRPAARLDAVEALSLRPMQREDLGTVLYIERSFPAPWTREMFQQELLQHGERAASIVAVLGGDVVGYVLCWFVADEVHIVNLAVHPRQRRRGVGRRLMREVFETAQRRGMAIATLEVRFHNGPAIRLYEALGFRQIAIRKHYYADNGEDALVMLKDLAPVS